MARTKRRVTIQELLESNDKSPEQALAALRRHLKSGTGDAFQTKGNFLSEILDRNEKNAQIIAEAKATQWKIMNYSILLYVAVVGAVRLTNALNNTWLYEGILSVVAALLIALIYLVARRMMDKTEQDLAFYRAHSRVNEDMLNITTGTQKLANDVVSARNPVFAEKHDFSESAESNRRVFTIWLYRILLGAGVIAVAVAEAMIWIRDLTSLK